MPVTRAMLMAAGLGTRLKPFTDARAKPLLPLMGVPTAQFAVDGLVAAGVRTIVANVHHLPDATVAGLEKLERGDAALRISDERALLLGSAGGLRQALPLLGEDEPFFLVNGDVLCQMDFARLAHKHALLRRRWGVKLTLAIFPRAPEGETYREIQVDPGEERISRLGERIERGPFFVGAAVIEPEAIAHLPAGKPLELVPEVLVPAVESGKAGAYLADGIWHDIGSSKLWHDAHLRLIDAIETGSIPPAWRRRIESTSRRVGPRAWMSRGALRRPELLGPSYWGTYPGAERPPAFLGPNAVLYGAAPAGVSDGIGFAGIWTSLKPLAR